MEAEGSKPRCAEHSKLHPSSFILHPSSFNKAAPDRRTPKFLRAFPQSMGKIALIKQTSASKTLRFLKGISLAQHTNDCDQ